MRAHWEILVVDDEAVMCESLASWLRSEGYTVETAASGREAIAKAREKDYAVYVVDLKMPGGPDGIETMMEIRRMHADASVIIVTAYAAVDSAITAMREGAQEYLVKPFHPQEISLLVERIVKVKNLQRANVLLRKKLTRQYKVQDILSKNPGMQEIFRLIRDIASLRSTVLIQGESGTGKELADGGTIFLGEIGDISTKLQMDLLRVLQERSFYRIGGAEGIRVDVRVMAATNVELQETVRAGRFRDDLF